MLRRDSAYIDILHLPLFLSPHYFDLPALLRAPPAVYLLGSILLFISSAIYDAFFFATILYFDAPHAAPCHYLPLDISDAAFLA